MKAGFSGLVTLGVGLTGTGVPIQTWWAYRGDVGRAGQYSGCGPSSFPSPASQWPPWGRCTGQLYQKAIAKLVGAGVGADLQESIHLGRRPETLKRWNV